MLQSNYLLKYSQTLPALIILILFFGLIYAPAYPQVSSKGFKGIGKEVGFLDLKVVETDPIIRHGKEAVPFDKPFFLKIKRPEIGKPSATLAISRVQKSNILPDTVKTVEIKEVNSYRTKPSKISKVESIVIFDLKKSNSVNLNSSVHPVKDPININSGDVYEESNNSEYVFVKVGPLVPEKSFIVEINLKNFIVTDSSQVFEDLTKESYLVTTLPGALDKRLKNILFPQIGVTTIWFKSNENNLNPRASLIVGVYHQLRPVDPDIPFKAYSWYSIRRFSVFLGLTINSIAEESLRDNLFGSNNIILGAGYQVSNAIRLSYGQVLFREINPNPVYSDRKTFASTSCLSLTLDLKVRDLLGGIVTVLGFK